MILVTRAQSGSRNAALLRRQKTSRAAGIVVAILLSLFAPGISRAQGLKDFYKDDFLIGAALNSQQINGEDKRAAPIVAANFNCATAENAMKWERIHPTPDGYEFGLADRLVNSAAANGLTIVGHTLIWHNQTPDWVFEDGKGNAASRDLLLKRMREHIMTVVGRYKGKVKGWDVVNEALGEDGKLRDSKWLRIIGPDYIPLAFEYARMADPNAELYYNDYSLENPAKRDGAVRLVKILRDGGVKVTGIGTQGHWGLEYPTNDQIESTIVALGKLGPVMVTELDIDVLPAPEGYSGAEITKNFKLLEQYNPYVAGLPDKVQAKLAARYGEIFRLFKKYNRVIDRVTFWGVTDGDSWKNNFPVRGRTNHPLLFDRDGRPKPAYDAVAKAAAQATKGNN